MLYVPNSGGALRDHEGNPVVPQVVLDRLAEINPRLTAKYVNSLGTFAVYMRWQEGDERYRMIQEQQIGDFPFDMLCALPDEVSRDEMVGWLTRQLRRVSQHREDVRRMLDEDEARVNKANETMIEEKAATIIEETMRETKTIDVGSRRKKIMTIK